MQRVFRRGTPRGVEVALPDESGSANLEQSDELCATGLLQDVELDHGTVGAPVVGLRHHIQDAMNARM